MDVILVLIKLIGGGTEGLWLWKLRGGGERVALCYSYSLLVIFVGGFDLI